MKKVLFMTGLLVGMSMFTMAQTSPAPAKKETKKEQHQKSDSTSHKAGHEKKAGHKTNKKQ